MLGKTLAALRSAVQRHLEAIFAVSTRRPALALAASGLIFLFAAFSIGRMQFQADIFKMFPDKGPLALFVDVMRWTGSSGDTYFLLEGEKGELLAEAPVFAGKLRDLKVAGAPAFRSVKYTVFDPAEAAPLAAFLSYAVVRPQVFVAPQDAGGYLQRLSTDQVRRSLRQTQTELASAGVPAQLVAADPLNLRAAILPRLKKASESLALDAASPYFLSRDGKVLIIIAQPSRPVTDRPFAKALVAGINEARRNSPVSISCAGAHLSAVTDEAVMKENVIVGVTSSLFIVLALFYLAYRRFLPTLLIPVILCYAVVLAVAAAGIVYPTMSVISLGFASLIVGIGTDYSIHLYDRFHFERSLGAATEPALRLAVVETGHALFTAGTTTSIPFLALAFSEVRVLAELGLVVGLGVIFSLYATLFFLPPLLLYMERRHPLKIYGPLPGFGLRRLWELAGRRPKALLYGCAALVLFLLLAATGIRFESELKNLQPKHSEAFQAQEKLERHLSISAREFMVAVEGERLDEVLAQGGRVVALAERYRREGGLARYASLLDVLNDAPGQQVVLNQIKGWPGLLALPKTVEREMLAVGFDADAFGPYLAGLATLSEARPVPVAEALEHLAASPFKGITDRFLARTGSGYHLVTYLYYQGKEFRQADFLRELSLSVPGARATGLDLVSRQLIDSVRGSFVWAVTWGTLLVLVLLLAHFNGLPGILYSLFPLYAGVIAMLGSMALFGMTLNFMNVMVLVTILGMGSDFGLHLGHRVRNCDPGEYPDRFVQAGRAVLLSALTTIAGFGSLALTDYTAMASIGSATNLGIVATTVFSLVAVPAFMKLLGARGGSCRGDVRCGSGSKVL